MKKQDQNIIQNSPLGNKIEYNEHYNKDVLFPIPRHLKRSELDINLSDALPFYGYDIWNDYETSWINSKGKPVVAISTFYVPCSSPNIIESKSMKLYLNSFSGTPFSSKEEVAMLMSKDLSFVAGDEVRVTLHPLDTLNTMTLTKAAGTCIDHLDVEIDTYYAKPTFLTTDKEWANEILHSNLLKSNCPVTGQPDWGTLIVEYEGPRIRREGLLKYIVSLRNQQEFHEQCIERIFMNILSQCKPTHLTVMGRYTRRGGKDINPCRSTRPDFQFPNQRLIRQ